MGLPPNETAINNPWSLSTRDRQKQADIVTATESAALFITMRDSSGTLGQVCQFSQESTGSAVWPISIIAYEISCSSFFFFIFEDSLFFKVGYFVSFVFIYLFVAVLGLRCCVWAFSRGGEWGLLSSCGTPASHCGGLWQSTCSRAQAH